MRRGYCNIAIVGVGFSLFGASECVAVDMKHNIESMAWLQSGIEFAGNGGIDTAMFSVKPFEHRQVDTALFVPGSDSFLLHEELDWTDGEVSEQHMAIGSAFASINEETGRASVSTHTTFDAKTGFFVPRHVAGDAEYDGCGPHVRLRVELQIFDGTELRAMVEMDAVETTPDWTRATESAWYMIYRADRPIRSVRGATSFRHEYIDTDMTPDLFTFSQESFVNALEYVGDVGGVEAGTKTGVKVYFNPITVEFD